MIRQFKLSEGIFARYASLLCETVVPFQEAVLRDEVEGTVKLIPYFMWGNRGLNRMRVWMPAR
jgi:DUF1680 family protein